MRRAPAELPEEHRTALVLRYYVDLTVPETARVLGCREGTVKSRLHRALGLTVSGPPGLQRRTLPRVTLPQDGGREVPFLRAAWPLAGPS